MKALKEYNANKRYHVGPDGVVRDCSATVRNCRYSEHYDSTDEAYSRRQKIASGPASATSNYFNVELTSDGKKPKIGSSLREVGDRARQTLITTGKRPPSQFGELRIDLPKGQSIELVRETYDKPNRADGVGVRYRLRYFQNPRLYTQELAEMNSKVDYALLVRVLDEYYTAANEFAPEPMYEQELKEKYDKTLQMVNEIELMSRGPEALYSNLGVDIFTHDDPTVLALEVDYDYSSLQSFDIKNSLKAHAKRDEMVKDVSIDISGSINGDKDCRWSIARIPEGEWFIGVDTPDYSEVYPAKTTKELESRFSYLLDKAGAVKDGPKNKEVVNYGLMVMQGTNEAVEVYENTVTSRIEAAEARAQEIRETMISTPAVESRELTSDEKLAKVFGEPEKKSFTERIGGLFK